MQIILGTTSEIKIQALKEILEQYQKIIPSLNNYQIIPHEAESLVPITPYNQQTIQGARNRVKQLLDKYLKNGDLFIGLESGLAERENMLFEECWCVIADKNGKEHLGYSSGLLLPAHIIKQMQKGKTHPEALKAIAEKIGLNHRDTWSIYSHGKLSRIESIKEAFRNALLTLASYTDKI